MSRVCGDGQAVGQHSTNDLNDHEEEAEHGRDYQLSSRTFIDVAAAEFASVTMLLCKIINVCN